MISTPERPAAPSSVGKPRGRPRKNGDVPAGPPRESILAAAGRLFSERGFLGTSTGDIAEAVGLTQSAIFYYFPSKEALVFELATEAVTKPLAHLAQMLEADMSPAAKLHRQ